MRKRNCDRSHIELYKLRKCEKSPCQAFTKYFDSKHVSSQAFHGGV